jgi:hypothetical protein
MDLGRNSGRDKVTDEPVINTSMEGEKTPPV